MTGDRPLYAIFICGLALTGVLVVYPALHAIWLSFFKADSFISTPVWVGLDNYARVLADHEFWDALRRGIVFAGTTILIQVVLGIALAMLLDAAIPMRRTMRSIVILPYLLPTLIVALTFRWMLNDPIGIVTVTLDRMGYGIVNWLGNERTAMLAVIVVSVWMWTPFVTVAFLAGLQNVPVSLYEAARVDGASAWQRFWHITLPLIRPAVVMVVILRTMTALSAFAAIFAATGGGPGTSTEILNLYAYRTSFTELNIGYGSALAMVLLTLTVFVSWLLFRRRRSPA